MQVLRLKRKTASKTEMAKLIISTYCLMSNIELTSRQAEILSYLSVYGFKRRTKELIVKSGIMKSDNSLENYITKMRKLGLIEKTKNGENELKKEIRMHFDNRIGIIIDLQN